MLIYKLIFLNSILDTKLTSFQRQLNLYGFRRVTKGEDQGAYFHQKFQRDRKDLVAEIRRLPGKTSSGSASFFDDTCSSDFLDIPSSFPDISRDDNPSLCDQRNKIGQSYGSISEQSAYGLNQLDDITGLDLDSTEDFSFQSAKQNKSEAADEAASSDSTQPVKMSKLSMNIGFGRGNGNGNGNGGVQNSSPTAESVKPTNWSQLRKQLQVMNDQQYYSAQPLESTRGHDSWYGGGYSTYNRSRSQQKHVPQFRGIGVMPSACSDQLFGPLSDSIPQEMSSYGGLGMPAYFIPQQRSMPFGRPPVPSNYIDPYMAHELALARERALALERGGSGVVVERSGFDASYTQLSGHNPNAMPLLSRSSSLKDFQECLEKPERQLQGSTSAASDSSTSQNNCTIIYKDEKRYPISNTNKEDIDTSYLDNFFSPFASDYFDEFLSGGV